MCDFSRVSAWFCDEKISLKKSCFYLYIRRHDDTDRATSAVSSRYGVYVRRTKNSKCYVLTCIISIFGQSVFWNSLFVTQFAVMLCSVERTSFIRVTLGQGVTSNSYE